MKQLITLVLLILDLSCFEKTVDPDQLLLTVLTKADMDCDIITPILLLTIVSLSLAGYVNPQILYYCDN